MNHTRCTKYWVHYILDTYLNHDVQLDTAMWPFRKLFRGSQQMVKFLVHLVKLLATRIIKYPPHAENNENDKILLTKC